VTRSLVVRLDNIGDVLLAGPAVRAVAAASEHVVALCGPRGRAAAELLPGVDEVLQFHAPWIDPDGHPVVAADVEELVERVRMVRIDEAIVFTSFHQSALPTALLLRLAGVATIVGNSEDYPGTLLDVRHLPDDTHHEVERNLALAATLGHGLPAGDDGRLQIRRRSPARRRPFDDPFVVVHPGASVPAREWGVEGHRAAVRALVAAGWHVAVTGGAAERDLTAAVAAVDAHRHRVADLGGSTDLAGLADVIDQADAIVVGNTGAAHVAAAVGTPVVSLHAATISADRWGPWRTPTVVLGDQDIACRDCRARRCPVPGHPCLGRVRATDVVTAVEALVAAHRPILDREGAA
jgi:ADP-heptose:LPS heptosyltransferase